MRLLASSSPLGALLLSAALIAPTVVLSNDEHPASQFAETIRPMLVEFCGACHDPQDDEDPVRFLRCRTADEVAQHRGIWANTPSSFAIAPCRQATNLSRARPNVC